MFFRQRFIPGLAIYSYMIGDEKTRECAVLDPTRDVDWYIDCARAEGFHIRHILETHVHADFVSGSHELQARLSGEAEVHCSSMGGEEWTPPYADQKVSDSHEISMGKITLRAMYTPGHTPEHVTWAVFDAGRSADTPWMLLTGDFVFVGDVGRPDLLGEAERAKLAGQLYESVFERIAGVPDFTELFPAHGAGSLCGKSLGSRASSTLGYERRFSKAFHDCTSEEWTRLLLEGMPIAPQYFQRMKKVNRGSPALIGLELPGQHRYSPREVNAGKCEDCLILDTRSKEAFAAGHIPNSLSIPLSPTLPNWAGWVLEYDRPILLVVDNASEVPTVVTHLLRIGIDTVRGWLEGGIGAWQMAGLPITISKTDTVHDLQRKIQANEVAVLDIRTDSEWNAGHIDGATHLHAGILKSHLSDIPQGKPLSIICGSGYRGSIATSIMEQAGFEDFTNVLGGMTAWNAAGLPTVKDEPAKVG